VERHQACHRRRDQQAGIDRSLFLPSEVVLVPLLWLRPVIGRCLLQNDDTVELTPICRIGASDCSLQVLFCFRTSRDRILPPLI
jgi:hypothetical protein